MDFPKSPAVTLPVTNCSVARKLHQTCLLLGIRKDIQGMDRSNARYLQRLFPGESKFRPFLSRDVADPWYTGDFTQTWADICEGCSRILEELSC